MTKLVLKVKGMHCTSCSTLIDKLVGKQPGVISIKTNYGAEKAAMEFDESKISLEKIDEFINKLGYDLIRPDEKGFSVEEEEVVGVFGEGGVEGGEFVGVVTAKKYPVIKRVVCKVLHRGAKSRNLGGKVGKRAVSGIEFSKLGKRGGTEKY